MTQTTHITIEALAAGHLDEAVTLSTLARWPHRRADWELLLGFSKGWVAVDEAGRVVGTAAMTPFGTTGGGINMVIVSEALRGKGIGRRLFAAALDAGKGRRLRLTATPDGEPLYRSLGFKPVARIYQRQGTLGAVPALGGAEDAVAGDLDAIGKLDAAAFGEDRTDLVQAFWTAGRFAVLRDKGVVIGFGCVRLFGRGRMIGPIVAGSTQAAQALIAHLAAGHEGSFMRIDLAAESGLDEWLTGLGLPQVDDGLVMWTEPPSVPAPGAARTIALASQAVG